MEEFDLERLPLIIMANWRGFSGGQRDLFEGVLQVHCTGHCLYSMSFPQTFIQHVSSCEAICVSCALAGAADT